MDAATASALTRNKRTTIDARVFHVASLFLPAPNLGGLHRRAEALVLRSAPCGWPRECADTFRTGRDYRYRGSNPCRRLGSLGPAKPRPTSSDPPDNNRTVAHRFPATRAEPDGCRRRTTLQGSDRLSTRRNWRQARTHPLPSRFLHLYIRRTGRIPHPVFRTFKLRMSPDDPTATVCPGTLPVGRLSVSL